MLNNPLEKYSGLPAFEAIRPEHVEPAVATVLADARERVAKLGNEEPTTVDWAVELERITDAVHRVWGPVVHLNAVLSSPELRAAYNECLPLITEFGTELAQNRELHAGFVALEKCVDPDSAIERQLITHALRDFRLAGVALDDDKRRRFADLAQELAQLQATFEQNLMDATDDFQHHAMDKPEVAGLPKDLLERARRAAEDNELDGWLLALDPPTYISVQTHAESEDLRRLYYEAWVTRASDQGPHADRWDNGSLIDQILELRHEASRLLGFNSYAEFSLATKMASMPSEVLKFLENLAVKSKPVAQRELDELTAFAGRELKPWDLAYFAERLKQDRFALADDELRPYFPLPRVLEGMFRVAETLFDVRLTERHDVATWHPDARFFDVDTSDAGVIGGVFVDLYARPNKRGGAWMDECIIRANLAGLEQQPVAYLVCNFNPPGESQPSLLTHNDVVTLFHEFGHSLHHLLTEIDFPSLSGINGVPWDAVELPSQFFENYAWLPEVLPWISGHVDTGKPLPSEKFETLNDSRTFLAGLAMVRQLELALFDFRLHDSYDPDEGTRVEDVLSAVRNEVAVMLPPAFNRFSCTFSHIFGGGYAAGYYSYKWAEVLAADAFSAFASNGSFDAETAASFRRSILAAGGSRDTMDAFTEFRGRAPSLEPLLRQSGIAPDSEVA